MSITDNTICSNAVEMSLILRKCWYTMSLCALCSCKFLVNLSLFFVKLIFFLLELRQTSYHRFQYPFNGMASHEFVSYCVKQNKKQNRNKKKRGFIDNVERFKTSFHSLEMRLENLIEQLKNTEYGEWSYSDMNMEKKPDNQSTQRKKSITGSNLPSHAYRVQFCHLFFSDSVRLDRHQSIF